MDKKMDSDLDRVYKEVKYRFGFSSQRDCFKKGFSIGFQNAEKMLKAEKDLKGK